MRSPMKLTSYEQLLKEKYEGDLDIPLEGVILSQCKGCQKVVNMKEIYERDFYTVRYTCEQCGHITRHVYTRQRGWEER